MQKKQGSSFSNNNLIVDQPSQSTCSPQSIANMSKNTSKLVRSNSKRHRTPSISSFSNTSDSSIRKKQSVSSNVIASPQKGLVADFQWINSTFLRLSSSFKAWHFVRYILLRFFVFCEDVFILFIYDYTTSEIFSFGCSKSTIVYRVS